MFVVGAYGVAHAYDATLNNTTLNAWPYIVALIGLSIAKAIFRYSEQYFGHYVAFKALEHLRLFLFSRMWPQAPALSASTRTGDLLARVTKDIDRIEVFFAHTIAPAVTALVVPLIVVAWVWTQTTLLAGLIALLFLLTAAFALPALGGKTARNNATQLLNERGSNVHYVAETIQGVREIVGFDNTDQRLNAINQRSQHIASFTTRTAWTVAVRRGLAYTLQIAALISLTVYCGNLYRDGAITLPAFLGTIAAVTFTFPSVRGMEDVIADLDKALASAERLFDVAHAQPVVTNPSSPQPLRTPTNESSHSITFNDVTFTYPNQEGRENPHPALKNIDLTIAPGEHVAIVGASGAGKTTLIQLLLRYWDVDSGAITISDTNIRDVTLTELRSTIALVTQNTHLFNMSIAENLRLAAPQATEQELIEACTIAGLADDIAAFPHGIDTPVGELGENMSGGQRQRLSLARALLSSANILVLDEFTSQLDENTAQKVRTQLAAARPHTTTIEITHRLTDAHEADKIVVMADGTIVEQGTPHELTTRGGIFASLLETTRR